VAYGFGLRRNETRMLDAADFGRNPHEPEFGQYGVFCVRQGKAKKSSRPVGKGTLATAVAQEEGFPVRESPLGEGVGGRL
jgi:hypothetical protein